MASILVQGCSVDQIIACASGLFSFFSIGLMHKQDLKAGREAKYKK